MGATRVELRFVWQPNKGLSTSPRCSTNDIFSHSSKVGLIKSQKNYISGIARKHSNVECECLTRRRRKNPAIFRPFIPSIIRTVCTKDTLKWHSGDFRCHTPQHRPKGIYFCPKDVKMQTKGKCGSLRKQVSRRKFSDGKTAHFRSCIQQSVSLGKAINSLKRVYCSLSATKCPSPHQ